MSDVQKISATYIALEAEYERDLHEVTHQCTEYTGEETIFEDNEINRLRKDDLVDIRGLQRLPNTNILRVGKKWAYIDARIPLQFTIGWSDVSRAVSPLFVFPLIVFTIFVHRKW